MPVQCQRVQVNPVNEYASIFEQRARDPALCEENNVIVNPAVLVNTTENSSIVKLRKLQNRVKIQARFCLYA